jgi:hypothetical protein
LATGCGSTIEKAKDFVSAGALFQSKGRDMFSPPISFIIYVVEILSPSSKASDFNSILPPKKTHTGG